MVKRARSEWAIDQGKKEKKKTVPVCTFCREKIKTKESRVNVRAWASLQPAHRSCAKRGAARG